MKLLAILILVWSSFACIAANEQDGRAWIFRPSGKFQWSDWKELPKKNIYEVVASKKIVAVIRDLLKKRFTLLSKDTATYFTGHYYHCPKGMKPYLVRAVYGQGGTGHFTISRHGDELLVYHVSLGYNSAAHKSALVINLDFTPTKVYTFFSVAE